MLDVDIAYKKINLKIYIFKKRKMLNYVNRLRFKVNKKTTKKVKMVKIECLVKSCQRNNFNNQSRKSFHSNVVLLIIFNLKMLINVCKYPVEVNKKIFKCC